MATTKPVIRLPSKIKSRRRPARPAGRLVIFAHSWPGDGLRVPTTGVCCRSPCTIPSRPAVINKPEVMASISITDGA